MYRIKTDIRQFKCDTREKVEKLIRNWVIRPTDLLYNRDLKRWEPIGESEEFEAIFNLLKESAEDDEDTIVTERVSSPAAQIVSQEDAEEAPASRGGRPSAAVLRPSRDIVRREEPAEPLPMPEAPEGVEGVAEDHEVTVMTERTADLLGLRDSDDIDLAEVTPDEPSVASEAEDEDEEDEAPLRRGDLPEELFLTNELSAPVGSLSEHSVLDELGDLSSVDDGWSSLSDDVSEYVHQSEEEEDDDRATLELDVADINLQDRVRARASSSSDEIGDDEVTAITSRADVSKEPRSTPSGPRSPSRSILVDSDYDDEAEERLLDEPLLDEMDDLPAPVVSSPSELPRLSDLSDLPRSATPRTDDDDLPAPVRSDDDLPVPARSDDEATVELSDLPTPALSRPSPLSEVSESSEDEATVELASVSEPIPEPSQASEVSEVEEGATANSEPIEAELDEDSSSPDEAPAELIEVEPLEDDGAFDALLGDDEAIEEPEPFVQDREFVSEGYNLELPFPVRPSDEDVAAGVKRSTATRAQKDRAFPYPQPKKIGHVQVTRYGYTADRSLFFIVVFAVILILLIATIAILAN